MPGAWVGFGLTVIAIVVFMVLSYVQLRRVDKVASGRLTVSDSPQPDQDES